MAFAWHDTGDCPIAPRSLPVRGACLEICLNLEGTGEIGDAVISPRTSVFYLCGGSGAPGRRSRERHRFLTAAFSIDFVRRNLAPFVGRLHPLLEGVLKRGSVGGGHSQPAPLTGRHLDLLASLRVPPVGDAALDLWYHGKAMELMAEFVFVGPVDDDLFCARRKRVAQDRTNRAIAVLRGRLAEPPSLDELARAVGCSAHHLSRTFSSVTGCTIPQYLRQLRLERAAELLRAGRHNVTETSLEVGYSSVSHFIQAFQDVYQCPPGSFAQPPDDK